MKALLRETSFPTLLLVLLLAAAAPCVASEGEGWPRELDTAKGKIVIYQPQVDGFSGDKLTSRAAVSVTPTGKTEPVFGAVWFEARIATDRDSRTVALLDLKVPQVRFPNASEENQNKLARFLEQEIPKWEMDMSLDRLLAALELAERQRGTTDELKNTPPKILFATEPTVLVSIDGEPRLMDIPNTNLKHVANTAFLMAHDPENRVYYLSAGADTWYFSTAATGPWSVTPNVPPEVAKLAEGAPAPTAEEAEEGPEKPPAILVATEPTELIVTRGPPEYAPIAGTDLLFMSNTESDVLLDVASQQSYVLLAGRWFAGSGVAGPWTYVASNALPPSFAKIPSESDAGHLLTWVAGSKEANEAVLDAAIPQTAALKRDATIEVEYDGEPKFEDVEETKLQYAANTSSQVLKLGDDYYCVHEGAWYQASSATGPWKVATEVPDEVQKIPPSSPMYNVKHVYVYDVTPTVVYVGYTPGYTHSYVYGGCVVYGTGWYYPPYWGPTYYYPHHSTWGFHVRYNPWYGWGVGFSYSTGRFTFSIGFGGWGRHRGGYWGPVGYRPYARGYNRGYYHGARSGYRAGYRAANRHQNIYNRPSNRPSTRPTTRPGTTARPTVSSRPNNVAVDRAGNVSQRSPNGSWQSRSGSASRPTQSYDRTYQSRQRGNSRASSYQRSGGARRSGGGRRR